MDFNVLKEFFIKEDIPGAIAYMSQFPEMEETSNAYRDLFENRHYIHYDIPKVLDDVLLIYQEYYRDVFYLKVSEQTASEKLIETLKIKLGSEDIEKALSTLFEANGYHILTGKTDGHYGPYVWQTTKQTTYDVELPEGMSKYSVNILSGFVMRSWLDYLTFGEYGTNGWIGQDGVINCIEKACDFESEKFRISLLKHEAQHAEDLKRWPDMTPVELEYRAKLVELIYTSNNNLLKKFISEANPTSLTSAHAVANARIQLEMEELSDKPIEEIQNKAKELFKISSR